MKNDQAPTRNSADRNRERIFGDYKPLPYAVAETGYCRQTLIKYAQLGLIDGKQVGRRWFINTSRLRREYPRVSAA